MKNTLSILLLTVLILSTTGFKGCGSNSNSTQMSLAERAVKAVAAVPSVVRVLFPNADPSTLSMVDAAGRAFSEFLDNKTADGWSKAEAAWNGAKPLLQRFNNSRLNQIVAVVDILLSQVTVPPSVPGAKSIPVVRMEFKEASVKELEDLVRVK